MSHSTMSEFCTKSVSATIAIPPRHLGTPITYVKSYLDRYLMKQFKETPKILIGYKNIKIAQIGMVSYYQPEVLVNVQYDVLLYHPQEVLLVEISDVSNIRTSLLVNGVFEGELDYNKDKYTFKTGQIIRCHLREIRNVKKALRFFCYIKENNEEDQNVQDGIVLKTYQQPDEADGRAFVEESEHEPLNKNHEAAQEEVNETE